MAAPRSDSKLILVSGSDTGMGTTCIMNYTALELAKSGSVLLIEFKRKTGFSIYMQKGHHERRRSLTEVINIPEKLSENVIRSPHNQSMFYLCMNLYEDCLKLQEYQNYKIIDIIQEAKKIFDYIILDLPADPTEPAVGVAFGKDLKYKPDHTIIFVDERVSSYKYLNDFNAILNIAGETTARPTTFVINKVATSHYQEYVEDYLPSLPLTKPINKIWLPFLPELITATNSGRIYETGVNKGTKIFFQQVDELAAIIREDKVGVDLSKSTLEKEMEKEKGKGFLGGLFTKKKSTLITSEEIGEHNREVDEMLSDISEVNTLDTFDPLEDTDSLYSEIDIELVNEEDDSEPSILEDGTFEDITYEKENSDSIFIVRDGDLELDFGEEFYDEFGENLNTTPITEPTAQKGEVDIEFESHPQQYQEGDIEDLVNQDNNKTKDNKKTKKDNKKAKKVNNNLNDSKGLFGKSKKKEKKEKVAKKKKARR